MKQRNCSAVMCIGASLTGFQTIPEPSSGFLVFVGLGILRLFQCRSRS